MSEELKSQNIPRESTTMNMGIWLDTGERRIAGDVANGTGRHSHNSTCLMKLKFYHEPSDNFEQGMTQLLCRLEAAVHRMRVWQAREEVRVG